MRRIGEEQRRRRKSWRCLSEALLLLRLREIEALELVEVA
jgi:hypothetical protein